MRITKIHDVDLFIISSPESKQQHQDSVEDLASDSQGNQDSPANGKCDAVATTQQRSRAVDKILRSLQVATIHSSYY